MFAHCAEVKEQKEQTKKSMWDVMKFAIPGPNIVLAKLTQLKDKLKNAIHQNMLDKAVSQLEEHANSLTQNKELRDQITSEDLNKICQKGPDRGKSLLLCLAATPEGQELLFNDEILRAKITSEGLNGICQEEPYRGISPLFFFGCK